MIIMTSNIGSRWIQELVGRKPEEMEQKITEALRANFKPEFLNRIDETIIFHNLTIDQIGEIVDIQVKKLGIRLADMNINLVLSDSAKSLLAKEGYDPSYGARPLKRAIQRHLENPLSMEILKGNIQKGSSIRADVKDDVICFNSYLNENC